MHIQLTPTRCCFKVVVRALVALAAALATLVVGPRTAGASGPTFTADPTQAPPGARVVLTSAAFYPGEPAVARFLGSEVGRGTADDEGVLVLTVTIPADAPVGTHPLDIEGLEGSFAEGDLTVIELPAPPPSTVPPSTVPASTVPASTVPASTVPPASAPASSGPAPSGPASSGPASSPATASPSPTTVGVTAAPTTIAPAAAPPAQPAPCVGRRVDAAQLDRVHPGETRVLRAGTFCPDEVVEIGIDGDGLIDIGRADSTGGLEISLLFPRDLEPGVIRLELEGRAGSHGFLDVTIVGAAVRPPAAARCYKSTDARIRFAPEDLTQGGTAVIYGQGWCPTEGVAVQISGVPLAAIDADAAGAFQARVTVPPTVRTGMLLATATGDLDSSTSVNVRVRAGAVADADDADDDDNAAVDGGAADAGAAGAGADEDDGAEETGAGRTSSGETGTSQAGPSSQDDSGAASGPGAGDDEADGGRNGGSGDSTGLIAGAIGVTLLALAFVMIRLYFSSRHPQGSVLIDPTPVPPVREPADPSGSVLRFAHDQPIVPS